MSILNGSRQVSKFSGILTWRKAAKTNCKHSRVCPRSADSEDLGNASVEDVHIGASEHLLSYILVKDTFPFTLPLMEAFRMLQGRERSRTTQVPGNLLFWWKGTLKMTMSKYYRHI